MIWPTTEFVWRETMLQLRRERLIAVSTISTVAVLLVLLGANLLFIQNLQLWTGRAAAEVEVSAYFNKDLDDLIDRLYATVDLGQRRELLGQIDQTLTTGVISGLGENAPIPPVFGPRSSSNTRL